MHEVFEIIPSPCPLSDWCNRIKIMQNIGIAFVKLGQYGDAITSFEHIMQEDPDTKTGFNLILCYFMTSDRSKMKYAFQQLLRVDLHLDDEDRYLPHNVSFPSSVEGPTNVISEEQSV